MHSAFAGEVRFVVENNGVKKLDTGFNKNIILNQGLHFFGGGNGTDMMTYCLVGSGNSAPTVTQNQLDNCVAAKQLEVYGQSYDYTPDASNTYKVSLTRKYVFTTLAGQNISEVGLASLYDSPSSNYLCTRALVKDASGNPTVLSLISGDTLTIYYRLWAVHSVLDNDQVISMSDGFGGSENYNVKSKIFAVAYYSSWAENISRNFSLNPASPATVSSQGLSVIGAVPESYGNFNYATFSTYSNNFSIIAYMTAGTGVANGNIRTIMVGGNSNGFGYHQIRFGRVSDDAPIVKNNTMELTIPIKFTWGRYEGVL